jgi:hypothetical protein
MALSLCYFSIPFGESLICCSITAGISTGGCTPPAVARSDRDGKLRARSGQIHPGRGHGRMKGGHGIPRWRRCMVLLMAVVGRDGGERAASPPRPHGPDPAALAEARRSA